jgi:putative effector of murein hydrolase
VTPLLLIAITASSHTSYSTYIHGTHWLITLLGPATVAFAVPIYKQRKTIRRHWIVLAVGVFIGSATAMVSAWGLAGIFGLDGTLRLSLLPRSISTPFAMTVSGQIGGVPDLTAVFVILTGVFGAAFGAAILYRLPLRSALARGALFGMGAHAVGSNRAHQINRDEGAIAGLVMVLAGIVNVLAAPLLAYFLK